MLTWTSSIVAKNEAGSHDDSSGNEGQVKLRGAVGSLWMDQEATVDGGARPVPWIGIRRQNYEQGWKDTE